MITIKEAEEILKKEYHIDNFLYVVKDILLPDFVSDRHEVEFKNNIFESVNQLGYSDKCEVTVFEVILKTGSHNRRVTITQEMFKILRGLGINNAIVAFANADKLNYRFSLLTSKYEFNGEKVVKVLSNPRRYSYSLGYGTKTKTAYDFLIGKGKVNSLDELINRFSVEVVNKQFYSEIAACFTRLVGGQRDGKTFNRELNIYGVTDQNKYAEFAVRLIGRIVFCWFLKEKKSENGVSLIPETLLNTKDIKIAGNYYHDVLEPLFFELLNTSIPRRKGKFAQEAVNNQIPYLNGGLFSPHIDDHYKFSPELQSGQYGIVTISNDWFDRFYAVLGQYNFTVDENTSYDIELSIDPEMLGRIFENLLAEINPETGENAKKSTGSFYTPRDIVDYMVDSSILEHLKTKTGISEEKSKALISYGKEDDELISFSETEKKAIVNALYSVTVLDPACGSGAFPIGVLQKIVYMLQEIDPDATLWFNKATENVSFLIRKEFEKKFNAGSLDYIRKLTVIQNSIFGIDIQPIAVEIARLRCFLSLVIEEKVYDDEPNRGINPLPNLDFKFIIANTLLSLPHDSDVKKNVSANQMSIFENQEHIDQLKAVREEYFSANDAETKSELKLAFSEIQKSMFQEALNNNKMASALYQALFQWEPFNNAVTDWFDADWMFGIKDGFDIVIANPPYIDSETMTKVMPYKRELYSQKYSCAKGNWDIYVVFIERGINLARNGGIITYIIPNKLVAAPYAQRIREYMGENHIYELRNYSNVKVFESVAVYPFVFLMCKGAANNYTFMTMMESLDTIEYSKKISAQKLQQNNNWDKYFCADLMSLNVLDKIEDNEKLGNIAIVKGAATVNEAYELLGLLENYDNQIEFFSFVNTGTIDPYQSLWGKEKTQYIKHSFYKPVLLKEKLRNLYPNRYSESIANKIIVGGMCKRLECYYDAGKCLAGKSTSIIYNSKYPLKYIIGLLNSKLMTFFYVTYFGSLSLAGGFFRIGVPQLQELPIKYIKEYESELIDLVDAVLLDPNNTDCRKAIDSMVYKIYGLTKDEIEIVEAKIK